MAPARAGSLLRLDTADAYEWSLYHLLENEALITGKVFGITYFSADGAAWRKTGTERPRYYDIGEAGCPVTSTFTRCR